jgi:hypothetical protein
MITVTNKVVILRKAIWDIRQHDVDGKGNIQPIIKPIPNSWHNIRSVIPNLLALFCCPSCQVITGADIRVSKIDHLGKLVPQFHCVPCKFYGDIYFDEYHNKPLYALALINNKKKEIELHYTHADNQADASKGINLTEYSVIGIGRAIGYMVDDKKGNELSV